MCCLFTRTAIIRKLYRGFFLMIRRPPRSTLDRSSAASDVYKRQAKVDFELAAELGNEKAKQLMKKYFNK